MEHNITNTVKYKIGVYKKRYNHSPRFFLLKCMFFVVKMFFKTCIPRKVLDDNIIKIQFVLDGGIGDLLIILNYIQCFYEKIKSTNISIDVSCNRDIRSICELKFLRKITNVDDNNDRYDLVISAVRLPKVEYVNFSKINKYAPCLLKYIRGYEDFYIKYEHLFIHGANCDCIVDFLSYIQGKKRTQQADLSNILGLSPNLKLTLSVKNEKETLFKFGLNKFITIQSGCGQTPDVKNATSTRMWPKEYWDRLISKLSKLGITLVAIGSSSSQHFEDVDVDLVGKTSLEELKVILKNSLLHIDTDSGNVHLRHVLHGGVSVVLFGPTSPDLLGYPENINIRTDKCPVMYCEWYSPEWQNQCLYHDEQICMKSITPDIVFEKVKEVLYAQKILD